MNYVCCRFSPIDTWFFRESRPQGSLGSNELSSIFPPSTSTILGALRTFIGDAYHAKNATSWRQFDALTELKAIIGDSNSLGSLSILGPYIAFKKQRLYPAPATLMVKENNYFLLDLAGPVRCDLGNVLLPSYPTKVQGIHSLAGAKPVTDCWLTEAAWIAILAGKTPTPDQVISSQQLFTEEPRIGIARDNQRRGVIHGMLYQTRHLRLHADVSIELLVSGIPDDLELNTSAMVRLGGEGRMASLSIENCTIKWPQFEQHNDPYAVIYYITPSSCAPLQPAGIPEGFNAIQDTNKLQAWQGNILTLPTTIYSVACARPLREGGWDLAKHQAKPVQSLLAPGSALFCANSAEISKLHGQCIDKDSAYGRGQVLVGRLPINSAFRK
ncbi:type III-B CRISPR module-associated Cmr3 family protein [Pseudomonas sp. F1_0610]|uniref:type III-B CRISPR module-associated Cmr3 family protein n=1 Tax=Pseudomonas sp. F1_0610 TaxID=3114284 RepID=UPI0039C350D8